MSQVKLGHTTGKKTKEKKDGEEDEENATEGLVSVALFRGERGS